MNPKQESEELLSAIFPLAEDMLKEYGEFYPCGGYTQPDGEIVHVGAKDPDTDHPRSTDLIDILRNSFREMACANQCRVAAIVCDVRVAMPSSDCKRDAIQACLDHVSGYSVEVFFPYQIIDGKIIYAESFSQEGKHEIFAR